MEPMESNNPRPFLAHFIEVETRAAEVERMFERQNKGDTPLAFPGWGCTMRPSLERPTRTYFAGAGKWKSSGD
jgi:hypothetical protein